MTDPRPEPPPIQDVDRPPDETPASALDTDVCMPDGAVSQSQIKAILTLIQDQRKRIDYLMNRVDNMVNATPGRAAPPREVQEKYKDDTLLAGKHTGKTHTWCVLNVPDYVMYLANNGWHKNWGFDDQHVEAAQKNLKAGGPRR